MPPRIFFPFFHGLRLLGPFAFFIFCPGRLVSPDSAARRCTSSRALPARVTDMDRGGGGVFPHYLHHLVLHFDPAHSHVGGMHARTWPPSARHLSVLAGEIPKTPTLD